MADHNMDRAGSLPVTPNPLLHTLDPLVGTWRIGGAEFNGTTTFAWMDGGFYLVQTSESEHNGRRFTAVEYIGYDEDTKTLRSHMMDSAGSNFVYTWRLEGDHLTVWFGDEGSDNFLGATLDPAGTTVTGAWQWPDGNGGTGGYAATMTRIG